MCVCVCANNIPNERCHLLSISHAIQVKQAKHGSSVKEVRPISYVVFFYGLLPMDTPLLADQQEFTYITSVRTSDAE